MPFRVEIKDNTVQAAFARLIRAGEDLTPVMHMVANHLADAAEESFEQERSPLGEAWPALAPATQKARAKSGYDGKMLQQTGTLARSILADWGPMEAVAGTNTI